MSTLIGENLQSPLTSASELDGYFHRFIKPEDQRKIGLEAEFFAVFSETGQALPYEGPVSIESILTSLSRRFGYLPVFEDQHVIALKKGETMISLEPGGQIESSAAPVLSAFDIEEQVQEFVGHLKAVRDEFFPGVLWLASGMHPLSGLNDTPWVPKARYQVMRDHMAAHGTLSHWMMKLTATNQVSFDYESEEHAMATLRCVFGITPVVTAMFAFSSFSEGRPNGFLSKRFHIWQETDPARTGIPALFLKPHRTFSDYLDYLLEMPMIFIVRDGRWIPMGGISFGRFIDQGYEQFQATWGDFELHLSTAFPEARLKQFLEIRGMDGQAPEMIPAVAALWKGLLYDRDTQGRAWDLVKEANLDQRSRLMEDVPRLGMKAKLGKTPVYEIARELVRLACASLARQRHQGDTRNECIFLDRIRENILDPRKSPAETLLERWEGPLNRDPLELVKDLSF